MKKTLLLILFCCLLSTIFYGQQITIKRIESRLITNEGYEFIGDLKERNNDLYTYSNWNNNGVLFLDSKIYKLSNINFNITTNSFVSRISRDKLFAFRTSTIDSVSINNLMFKNIGNSFYEVLFENGDNSFLKKYDIVFQRGIDNRLGGKTLGNTKALVAYNYLIKSGEVFKMVELNKSSIIGLIDDEDDKEALISFVKQERLSYKKVKDVVKIFRFIFENSSKII